MRAHATVARFRCGELKIPDLVTKILVQCIDGVNNRPEIVKIYKERLLLKPVEKDELKNEFFRRIIRIRPRLSSGQKGLYICSILRIMGTIGITPFCRQPETERPN